MYDDAKRIIEVNGVKIEVDLREARRIDTYKVGDPVKVLVKEYQTYKSFPGVIVGFTEYRNTAGIDVLYLDGSFSSFDIKIATITDKSTGIEIGAFNEYECVFSRAEVLEKIDSMIRNKEEEVRVLKNKKKAFIDHFGKAFKNEMVDQSAE